MIHKEYHEWYDPDTDQVNSTLTIKLFGIPIYNFYTTTNSFAIISGYMRPDVQERYLTTQIGFHINDEETI